MQTAKESLVSTEHARSRFAPHGEVLITPDGELIRFDVHGPFNAEALQALGYAMAQLLMSWKPKGPFATVSYWHKSMLASPDALQAYRGVLRQGRGMLPREVVNVWYVPPSVEGRALMEMHWRQLYVECDYPLEIFDTEAAALACVQERLHAAIQPR
ncbi:hypothetical protein RQP54_01015 [Curvibacter sp. APW13]|uniref:hypothetical protein n=1 Tax=Curvibacter sp. APW13 TaxID=3077236 RepID=UPI0028DFCB52|nr:hypothetical protein [Curvibacter sp. APW13]MDT8989437.1 hypothetical protein [Curvibacter sp. APW13]